MRLTVRTLLLYLDDCLDAADARDIGLRLQTSQFAQDLVARIKRVAKTRKLGTPPLDAGQAQLSVTEVAAYLDNRLDPQDVLRVERLCLEDDEILSEVVNCHAIESGGSFVDQRLSSEHRERMASIGEPGAFVPPESKEIPVDKPHEQTTGQMAVAEIRQDQQHERRLVNNIIMLLLVATIPFSVWSIIQTARTGPPLLAPSPPEPERKTVDEPSATKTTGATGQAKAVRQTPPDGAAVKPAEPKDESPSAPPDKSQPPQEPKPAVPGARPPLSETGEKKPVPVIAQKPRPAPEVLGRVQQVEGLVFVSPQADALWQAAQPGTELRLGAALAVAPGSRGAVNVTGVGEIVLGQGSLGALQWHKTVGVPLLFLDMGYVGLQQFRAGNSLVIVLDDDGLQLANRSLGTASVAMIRSGEGAPRMLLMPVEGPVQVGPLSANAAAVVNWTLVPAPGQLWWRPGRAVGIPRAVPPGTEVKWLSQSIASSTARSAANRVARSLTQETDLALALFEALGDQNVQARETAAMSLMLIQAIDRLADALAHPRSDVREHVMFLLREWLVQAANAKVEQTRKNLIGQALRGRLTVEEIETAIAMIEGPTDEERELPAAYQLLIGRLPSDSLTVRALAINNLRDMTRQDLDYRADGAMLARERAIRRWQATLENKGLPPRAKTSSRPRRLLSSLGAEAEAAIMAPRNPS